MANDENPSQTPREAVRRAMRISNERDVVRDESIRGELERAHEQHTYSEETTTPSGQHPNSGHEGPVPRSWLEAIPQIIWVVLVLGCGLELIISLLDGHFGRALLALVGLLGFTAMLIHADAFKKRMLAINPNWIFLSSAIFVAALIFSPFVEEKRWPFSAWFPATIDQKTPTADEIAAAVVKALPKGTTPSAQPMFAEAGMKRPSDPRTELVGGPYIASDIQRLIPIFFEFNEVLTRIAPVFREEQQLINSWQAQLQNLGAKAFVENLQELAGKVASAHAVVNQFIEKNNADRNELGSAVYTDIDAVDQNANEIGNLLLNVQALATVPFDTQVPVLSKDIRRLDNAALKFNGWVQASISNVQTKIRRLRDYKP